MIDRDDIARACRNQDAIAEEHHDLPKFFADRNVEISGLVYVAEQRALRMVMAERGEDPNVSRPRTVALSAAEAKRLTSCTALFVEGFAVGLTVEHVDDDPRGD